MIYFYFQIFINFFLKLTFYLYLFNIFTYIHFLFNYIFSLFKQAFIIFIFRLCLLFFKVIIFIDFKKLLEYKDFQFYDIFLLKSFLFTGKLLNHHFIYQFYFLVIDIIYRL